MKKTLLILLFLQILLTAVSQKTLSNEKLENNLSYFVNSNILIDTIGEKKENVKTKQLQYGFSFNQSFTRYGLPTAVVFKHNYKNKQ
jgi:hypothetical protein